MHTTQKNKANRFIVLFLFFILPGLTFAQPFSYGIKGGLNIANTSFEGTSSKTGFNIYGFADYNFSKIFALSLQSGYSQKGFQTETSDYYENGVQYNGNYVADLNFINITLAGKVKFKEENIIPYILAGPTIGIIVSENASSTGNISVFSAGFDSFVMSYDNNSFGITTGAGLEVNVNKKYSIIFEADYNFDLTAAYDPPGFQFGIQSPLYSTDVKNYVCELMVGVKF